MRGGHSEKPVVDPFCLCGQPHPCRWHSAYNDGQQLVLFEVAVVVEREVRASGRR